MKTIKIIDMTLCASASLRETALTFKEKLEIARALDRLKVDTIELAPIDGGKADQLAKKTIAATVSAALSAAVDIAAGNVAETWNSVRIASHPQLNLLTPVSPVQMEYTCHKKAPAMLEAIRTQVAKCRFYCENVEFTAVDASRAEPEFLYAAIDAAIHAGANKVTLCDTSGVLLPDEFGAFVKGVRANVADMERVALYVQPSDEMGMALACAAAAIQAGADGVKCTALPAGYATLEMMARFARIKGAALDISLDLRATELTRAVNQIQRMVNVGREDALPMGGAAVDTANLCLTHNDKMGEVISAVRELGYELSDEDYTEVYNEVQHVFKNKRSVDARELKAIIDTVAMQVPPTYSIKYYVINSCNVIKVTASIMLDRKGEEIQDVGVGNGPIDAAFRAIEKIVGRHFDLDDFQIQTVTEGHDALGSAQVKLRADKQVYTGSGVSTDIIEASIRAYISALNKIVYEEA